MGVHGLRVITSCSWIFLLILMSSGVPRFRSASTVLFRKRPCATNRPRMGTHWSLLRKLPSFSERLPFSCRVNLALLIACGSSPLPVGMNVPTPDKVSEEIQLDGTELLPKPKRLLNRLLHGALTVLVTADSSKRKPLSKAEPYEASDCWKCCVGI